MGLLLTTLTVTLALARGGLLRGLRSALQWIDTVAGVLLILAGLYLVYYWWYDLVSDTGARDVAGGGLELVVPAAGRRHRHLAQRPRRGVPRARPRRSRRGRGRCGRWRTGRDGRTRDVRRAAGPARRGGGLDAAGPLRLHGVPRRFAGGGHGRHRLARRPRRPGRRTTACTSRPTCSGTSRRSSIEPAASPALAAFLDHVDQVITVHGYGREGYWATPAASAAGTVRWPSTSPRHLRRSLPAYEVVTDLERHPARAPRPPPPQPGQPGPRRRRAARAAATRPRHQPAVLGLGGSRASTPTPRPSSTRWSPHGRFLGRPDRRVRARGARWSRPCRDRRAGSGSGRAGGWADPARTRPPGGTSRRPPQCGGRGMSSPGKRASAAATSASSSARSASTCDCGDAHAPMRDARGRLAKYASASSCAHRLHRRPAART